MKRKNLLIITVILCLGVLVFVGVNKTMDAFGWSNKNGFREPEKTALKGKPMPEFEILLPDSVSHYNTNNIDKSKAVLLFYFRPDCPYCRLQMEDMIKGIDELKEIQICLVTPFPFGEMKSFYKEFQLNKYANIIIGKDVSGEVGKYFEIGSVPYLAIYNQDKLLKDVFIGSVPIEQIRQIVLTQANL